MRRSLVAFVLGAAAFAGVAVAAPARIDTAATVAEPAERVALREEPPVPVADVRPATAYKFDCASTEATVAAAGGPRLTFGSSTIYIGTRQISAINQDPVMVRFDGGARTWCRDDIEATGADGRGYGLLWDGDDALYAAFSVDGTQGTSDTQFQRFTGAGWLPGYGSGGGPKVAVLLRIAPADGEPQLGTFLRAQLTSGRTNSFTVTDLSLVGDVIRIDGASFFSPLDVDRSRLTCTGSSPFDVTYDMTLELDAARSVRVADNACV